MKIRLLSILLIFAASTVKAQQIIPYSYYQYQKLNKSLYSLDTRFHSSLKPVIGDDTVVTKKLDSLLGVGLMEKTTWVGRKLFNEHLVQIDKEDYSFYLDFLTDLQVGRDNEHKINTFLNTRGYQLGGNIGKKFSFYSSGFENQARFNNYLTNYVNTNGVISGMANDKFGPTKTTKDWAYATAVINYTPSKYITIALGQDKNFIGDGYRSMLLSDFASPYPFLKLTATLG
ncbi:MAG: gliding motility protein RemB, partial [Pedobacter sp.]